MKANVSDALYQLFIGATSGANKVRETSDGSTFKEMVRELALAGATEEVAVAETNSKVVVEGTDCHGDGDIARVVLAAAESASNRAEPVEQDEDYREAVLASVWYSAQPEPVKSGRANAQVAVRPPAFPVGSKQDMPAALELVSVSELKVGTAPGRLAGTNLGWRTAPIIPADSIPSQPHGGTSELELAEASVAQPEQARSSPPHLETAHYPRTIPSLETLEQPGTGHLFIGTKGADPSSRRGRGGINFQDPLLGMVRLEVQEGVAGSQRPLATRAAIETAPADESLQFSKHLVTATSETVSRHFPMIGSSPLDSNPILAIDRNAEVVLLQSRPAVRPAGEFASRSAGIGNDIQGGTNLRADFVPQPNSWVTGAEVASRSQTPAGGSPGGSLSMPNPDFDVDCAQRSHKDLTGVAVDTPVRKQIDGIGVTVDIPAKEQAPTRVVTTEAPAPKRLAGTEVAVETPPKGQPPTKDVAIETPAPRRLGGHELAVDTPARDQPANKGVAIEAPLPTRLAGTEVTIGTPVKSPSWSTGVAVDTPVKNPSQSTGVAVDNPAKIPSRSTGVAVDTPASKQPPGTQVNVDAQALKQPPNTGVAIHASAPRLPSAGALAPKHPSSAEVNVDAPTSLQPHRAASDDTSVAKQTSSAVILNIDPAPKQHLSREVASMDIDPAGEGLPVLGVVDALPSKTLNRGSLFDSSQELQSLISLPADQTDLAQKPVRRGVDFGHPELTPWRPSVTASNPERVSGSLSVSKVPQFLLSRLDKKESSLQVIEVDLEPARLGKLKIELSIGADQKVESVIVVGNESAREALELQMKSLKARLSEAGIDFESRLSMTSENRQHSDTQDGRHQQRRRAEPVSASDMAEAAEIIRDTDPGELYA